MGPWRVLRVEEGRACGGLTVREKQGSGYPGLGIQSPSTEPRALSTNGPGAG